jgi:hypothetical protein
MNVRIRLNDECLSVCVGSLSVGKRVDRSIIVVIGSILGICSGDLSSESNPWGLMPGI